MANGPSDTESLRQWAEQHDRVFPESIRDRRQDAGAEHEVWFQDERVFKAAVTANRWLRRGWQPDAGPRDFTFRISRAHSTPEHSLR